MRAIIHDRYGPPEVLRLEDVPRPEPGPGEVLVRVRASSVTTADWRLRASAFPGGLWLVGRLMTGLRRPRQPILGGEFSGDVAATGDGVTEFSVGNQVFGFSGSGSNAEYVLVPADGAITHVPAGIAPEHAAAVPFGGLCALVFLRDFAAVQPGDRVLIVGASGGVGAYAVQIARQLGAVVTGVCSTPHVDAVRALGANQVIDYQKEDVTRSNREFDVVFDTVGVTDFSSSRAILSPRGRYVPLNFGIREAGQAFMNCFRRGPKVVLRVNGDSKADLEHLAEMIESEELQPVIDCVYPLEEARAAHAQVEKRHRLGAVILSVAA